MALDNVGRDRWLVWSGAAGIAILLAGLVDIRTVLLSEPGAPAGYSSYVVRHTGYVLVSALGTGRPCADGSTGRHLLCASGPLQRSYRCGSAGAHCCSSPRP